MKWLRVLGRTLVRVLQFIEKYVIIFFVAPFIRFLLFCARVYRRTVDVLNDYIGMDLGRAIGFGFSLWLVYMANNILSAFVFFFYLGNFWAHVYRYLSIIPVIFFFAYLYAGTTMGNMYDEHSPKPWLTGLFWLASFFIIDMFLWYYIYGFSAYYIFYSLLFWKMRFWPYMLFSLLIAPPIMVSFRNYLNNRKRRRHLRKRQMSFS